MKFLILIFISIHIYAQDTRSYVFYHSSLFEKSLNYTKEVLGDENVVVSQETGISEYVRSIEKDIASGKIQPGQQVILQIYSHGAENKGEVSHRLNIQSDDNNLDDIIPIRDQLEAMGVKVGILDASCYSGNSLALSSDKTCVVSSQTAKFEASASGGNIYETFAEMFWKERIDANQKQNMNETFYGARDLLKKTVPFKSDRPEISEPYYLGMRDKLDKWFFAYQRRAESFRPLYDEIDKSINSIKSDIGNCQNIGAFLEVINFEQTGLSSLEKSAIINAFQNLRDNLISLYEKDKEVTNASKEFDAAKDKYFEIESEEEKVKFRSEVADVLSLKHDNLKKEREVLFQQVNEQETALLKLLNNHQENTPCKTFQF